MTYAEPPDLAYELLPLQDAPSVVPLASWKLTFFQKNLTNTFQIRAIQPPCPESQNIITNIIYLENFQLLNVLWWHLLMVFLACMGGTGLFVNMCH